MNCKCLMNDEPTMEDIKNLRKLDWNVTIEDEDNKQIPMQVCIIPDCIHSKGGKYGVNNLYVYRANIKEEDLTPSDLTPFNGDVCWSYKVYQKNYFRKDELVCGTFCKIYCAGEQVYELRAGWNLMPHMIMTTICKLKELSILTPITDRNYEKDIVGRKIFFKDKPAIISRYIKRYGEIIVIPDPDEDVKDFGRSCWMESEDEYEDILDGGIKVDILSSDIYWFRD